MESNENKERILEHPKINFKLEDMLEPLENNEKSTDINGPKLYSIIIQLENLEDFKKNVSNKINNGSEDEFVMETITDSTIKNIEILKNKIYLFSNAFPIPYARLTTNLETILLLANLDCVKMIERDIQYNAINKNEDMSNGQN